MDKREEIIQAALDLFVEKGFHGAPMSDIAERAKVAVGTMYRYFPSKDALIDELFYELQGRLKAFVEERYPRQGTTREKYEYLLRASMRYLMDYPQHFLYMEQYFNSPYSASLHRDRILGKDRDALWEDIFEKGTEAGEIKSLPRGVLFSLAFGPMIALLRDYIRGFVKLGEKEISQFTAACWDAIKK
ncbi:MAG: TetR/AcrR family transcriptional regulator [Syntrophales bacterium]|nr:TetR/AcrR family transcriptional regulator [Syntrophales bacterium]